MDCKLWPPRLFRFVGITTKTYPIPECGSAHTGSGIVMVFRRPFLSMDSVILTTMRICTRTESMQTEVATLPILVDKVAKHLRSTGSKVAEKRKVCDWYLIPMKCSPAGALPAGAKVIWFTLPTRGLSRKRSTSISIPLMLESTCSTFTAPISSRRPRSSRLGTRTWTRTRWSMIQWSIF